MLDLLSKLLMTEIIYVRILKLNKNDVIDIILVIIKYENYCYHNSNDIDLMMKWNSSENFEGSQ